MSRSSRHSEPPKATAAEPDAQPVADSVEDRPGSASENPDLLMELTIAEQEAEELLAERRRQLEEAQATEWERWTNKMDAELSAERERREQVEVALGRSQLAHADAKRAAAEAARTLAESRAEAEKRVEGSESKLEASQAELADVRRELAQTRSRLEEELKETRVRLEAEVAQAEKDRDEARAELEAHPTKEIAESAGRISELEAQLEAERARVADLDAATELLENQRATAVRWAEEAQRAAREESRRHSVAAARDS